LNKDEPLLRFFGKTRMGTYLSRPNRFIMHCDLEGREIRAFLPNPGRLQELLFPGTQVYLEEAVGPNRSTSHTVVALMKGNRPVVLHTHKSNAVARFLLEKGRIPGMEGARVIREEVTHGRSRFDLLLQKGSRELFLEVKSCTLFSKRAALFPDAVTARGKRHVEELASLAKEKRTGAVLFLVHSPEPEYFLPDLHTDPAFALALFQARKKIPIIPLAIQWRKNLTLGPKTRVLPIPWDLVERETRDRGSYLLILKNRRLRNLQVGKAGKFRFEKGFYIYVGSAMAHLSKRVERHRRLRKNKFWHIDYLREVCDFHAVLPVLTADDLECGMAGALRKGADEEIIGFGASDCACPSHLFRMDGDPLDFPWFHDLLYHFRVDRFIGPGEVPGCAPGPGRFPPAHG
jgi:sugar fermentation stimulation protein A